MLSFLFPKQIDNTYRGYWLAVWLLVPLVFVKLAMGTNSLFNTREIIVTADAIPLDAFSPEAQALVVFLFKSWGLGLSLISLLGVLALIRYRAMIPLVYLVLTFEQVGRRVIAMVAPVAHVQTGPTPSSAFVINLVLSAACLIGLALSLGKTERSAVAT